MNTGSCNNPPAYAQQGSCPLFNGIRFSCHIFNTEKEVDFAADIIYKELGK
jgi:selenocysteine lyase/cysteine desulfurase